MDALGGGGGASVEYLRKADARKVVRALAALEGAGKAAFRTEARRDTNDIVAMVVVED